MNLNYGYTICAYKNRFERVKTNTHLDLSGISKST